MQVYLTGLGLGGPGEDSAQACPCNATGKDQ
jgi:hypothetical protein